ncbi:MAG: coenzyme F420-0:L-glutamate ligase [Actinomycetota bacterium]
MRQRAARRPDPARLVVEAVDGLPEVCPGDDLAALIAARATLADGDVVAVAQKVVSKAEGALARPEPGESHAAARRRLALAEAERVVVDTPWVLITRTRHGLVCANGGVDASNAGDGVLVLLPVDPDASARRLRAGLAEATGADVAVVVTDTFGRPWRRGQTDVAIGVAGMAALDDERGGTDRDGVPLEVTEVALADEVAAASDLVRRKASGSPVVLLRGLARPGGGSGAAALVRPREEDLFAHGRGRLAARLRAATTAGAPATADSPARWERDDLAALAGAAGATLTSHPDGLLVRGDRLAAGLVVAGLVDQGHAVAWREDPDGVVLLVGGPRDDTQG